MEEVVFEIEAVTPMFLGGADMENGVPEFRAASIKGLLRYWYRAIYPKAMSADEDRIFGSTDGRSPFRLKTDLIEPKYGEKGDLWEGTSIAYLGYGLLKIREKKTWTQRKYFHTGSKFRLSFRFPPSSPKNDKIFILRAFWALSMLGGLGSRSRRGFGSYKITSCNYSMPEVPPFTFADQHTFAKALKEFVNLIKYTTYDTKDDRNVPTHTCFSSKTSIVIQPVPYGHRLKATSGSLFMQGNMAMAALEDFALHLKNYRSAKVKAPKYIEDHDLMLHYLENGQTPESAPKRAAFGLPHNYFFSSTKMSGNVDLMDNDGKGRRGSPLFIHVQGFSDNSACGVFTFLPATLIPPTKKIRISGRGRPTVDVPPPDFSAVRHYMDDLINEGGERIL